MVVITDLHSQLSTVVHTLEKLATTVPRFFSENWMVNYGIPSEVLVGNGP